MAHSYSSNLVHCVFSTKGRVNLISDQRQEHLYTYLFGIAKKLKVEILAIGGISNHVHILLALPAAKTLSEVVRDLKANSSRWMREEDRRFGWQEGFGAFRVSASQVPVVKAYIRNQAAHHAKRTFEEEFLALLRKSGLAFSTANLSSVSAACPGLLVYRSRTQRLRAGPSLAPDGALRNPRKLDGS